MKTYKITLKETGKTTKIGLCGEGYIDAMTIDRAKDALVRRDWPGHFVCRDGEICCAAGDLTEHTGKFVHFTKKPV